MKKENKGLSRRQFMAGAAAISGAALLPQCSGQGGRALDSTISLDPNGGGTSLPHSNSAVPICTRKLGKT